MTESSVQRDPVEQLAEEFMVRLRQGERPAIADYAAAHPEWADEIRDLFPALVMMEEAKPPGTEPRAREFGPDAPPGQLGDYRILREVARGGMGVVYEAEQVALGRHVALKVLPTQGGGDPLRLLRFRREARSAARLHHTNIVPVFDVGSAEGVHYYAMQFIQGQGLDEVLEELRRLRFGAKPTDPPAADLTASLADGLRTGEFALAPIVPVPRPIEPPPEPSAILTGSVSHYFRSVARLGVQAADALAYAHGQRVLHRDVKPSNLLLDRQGTLWLTDFGLAKDDGDDLTRTGDIVGTLRYMAPERFQGISDPRTDVYALGVTLYELLTLQPAFPTADRMLLVRQITQTEPARPRALDPTLPRDLETIVLKAIKKEPARRYPTADEMAEDLRRFLSDRPIRARRSTWREQAWRWCRRNPAVAASLTATIVLLVLLVLGLSTGSWLVWRAKRDVEQAKGKIEKTMEEQQQALYVQWVALADRELQANNLARAEALLAQCPEERRGWEWHYLNRHRGRLAEPLTGQRPTEARGGLSRDGQYAAIGTLDGAVILWDLKTRKQTELTPYQSPAHVAFSPVERLLVTANEPTEGNATINLWELESLTMQGSWEFPFGGVQPLAISPDGRRLVTGSLPHGLKEHRVDVWDVKTGRHLTALGRHQEPVQGLAFSADGRLVASVSPDGRVRMSECDSGRVVHEFRHDPREGFHFWCVAFSPDGRRLAAGYGMETNANSGGVLLWDVASGTGCGKLPGQQVLGLSYGPGGRLLSSGIDGTVRVWDPDRLQELLSFRGHIDSTRCLGFTPDGHRFVTAGADRVVRVWDATPVQSGESLGEEVLSWNHHANGVITARFLPESRDLVTAGSDGTIQRVSAQSNDDTPRRLAQGENLSAAVSPDGRMLSVAERGGTGCRLIDAASGHALRSLQRPAADTTVYRPQFSPDGAWLAGCDRGGNQTFLWNVHTGQVHPLKGHHFYVYDVAFCPGQERRWLASVSTAGEVFIWNVMNTQLKARFEHRAACAVAFSGDGKRMVTAGWDRVVQLWDTSADDPTQWKKLDAYSDPTSNPNVIAFSPKGDRVAWGGTDSAIKVWRLGTQEVTTLRGHRDWVWDVSFRADGGAIVSASRDGTVKLWTLP